MLDSWTNTNLYMHTASKDSFLQDLSAQMSITICDSDQFLEISKTQVASQHNYYDYVCYKHIITVAV